MEERLIIHVPISISREAYQIWEKFFLGHKNENIEKSLFDHQEKNGNIDGCAIPEQDIQDCFETGLRVLDALSPNFLKQKEKLKKEHEAQLSQLRLPQGFPPF